MQQIVDRMPRRAAAPPAKAKRRVALPFLGVSALYLAALWLLFGAGEGAMGRWLSTLAATWGEDSLLGGLLAGLPSLLWALALGGDLLFALLILAGHPLAHRWLQGAGAGLALLGLLGALGARAAWLPLVQSGLLLGFLGWYAKIVRRKSRRTARGH